MQHRFPIFAIAIACLLPGCSTTPSSTSALRKALTFHASFDVHADAEFAAGDARLFTADSMNKRDTAKAGLHAGNATVLAPGTGRFGGALRFNHKQAPVVFFRAPGNFAYATNNWSGAISFWLHADPAGELAEGFADPIQITPRAWNDASFFVEFEKRQTIPFRLGVYADFKTWNPDNRKWEQIPAAEKPLLTVAEPPFRKGKWTHVVITFERFNTGAANGMATLYLDGTPRGMLAGRKQTFTWNLDQTAIMLGLSYIGSFDDLALFNRALTPIEVQALHALPEGVRELHPAGAKR